ncbi:hypothetical protein BBJ28_00020098 [Nothophytophthora sp. Chile5]|nr:hypothetical protein BBJ28_00020098 [Nothophytophthora sp. Chile5]
MNAFGSIICLQTLPSGLRFPGAFDDQYNWCMLPSQLKSSQANREKYRRVDPVKQEALRIASTPKSASQVRRGSLESKRAVQEEAVQSPHEGQVFVKSSPDTRDSNLRRDRNEILSKADQILRDAGIFDLQTDEPSNQEAELRVPNTSTMTRSVMTAKTKQKTRIVASSTREEWPDPILELERIIGFSNDFPRMLLWLPDGSACVYSSSSTIIIREFLDGNAADRQLAGSPSNSDEAAKGSVETTGTQPPVTREHFLHGHSAAVCAIALTGDGRLLVSAETMIDTTASGLRVWDLASHECLTVVKAQAKGVHALCFSTPTKRRLLLCAVGHDECFRTQIFVWDCSNLQYGTQTTGGPAISLLARQTSDFPVTRVAFSPYEQQDQYHLVTCGRENIRYWRVNPSTGHLTGCPVILNEYSRGTVFTDVGFDTMFEAFPSNIRRVRPLYVASSLGTLLVVDYDSRQVLCVYQLHDASINCLSVNEGFCVTGSDDGFLRVWPLDFTDFFLEAQHEAGVSSVDVSADGMKVLVGSRNSAIGVLDISDQRYATVLRSHTQEIVAMAPASWHSPLTSFVANDAVGGGDGSVQSELITASSDGTLRVWDAPSGQQLYEFDTQQDHVTSVAASSSDNGIVAVGFASGCTRIFDIHRAGANSEASSSVLREFQQHQSFIRHLAFDVDGQCLYTSGAGKQLCLYDARQQDYTPLKMLLVDFDPLDGRFVLSNDKKWLAVVSGDRQGVVLLDPRSLRVISTVRPPRQSSSSSAAQEDTLKLVQLSSNATELLALSTTDRLHIFSLTTLAFVQSMPLLGQRGITALTTSSNAKYMATGGADGSLCVWNWDTKGRSGRMHQSFIGHSGKVSALAFTEDGTHVVATGESSAICVWRFHGNRSPASPRALRALVDGNQQREDGEKAAFARRNAGDEEVARCLDGNGAAKPPLYGFRRVGPGELSPSLHVPVPSTKPNFRLSLEMDALTLDEVNGRERSGAPSLSVSSVASQDGGDVPIVRVTAAADVQGRLELSSAMGGFDPSVFAWSYETGKLLYAKRSVLVQEDLATGRQAFCDDHTCDEPEAGRPSVGIALLRLSPSGDRVATVSSRFDFVSIRSLSRSGERAMPNNTDGDDQRLIALLPATQAVTALEFARSPSQQQIDKDSTSDLLCVACTVENQQQQRHIVLLASIATSSITWSSMDLDGWQALPIRQLTALSDSRFVLFSVEQSCISVLDIHPVASTVEIHPLVNAFPSQVQLVSLCNEASSVDRLRFLVGVDRDRYCYFYDLQQAAFLATTRLSLLRVKKKTGDLVNKKKESKSTSSPIEFMAWMSTIAGKSRLVTGSRADNALCVYTLPTNPSARTQVDWQRVARGGLSLSYSIVLDGGSLRSLSVDPVRGIGLAVTDDSTVVFVCFDSPTITKTVKKTLGDTRPFAAPQTSWALEGAVLLSTSSTDSAIRVWLPELGREVANFHVASTSCTCFAVNPFPSPEGVTQSMVLAGYSDGSLRVFDLREMRLLARFELASAPLKTARYGGGSFDRIEFVGAFTALVVTSEHRVLLVDVSNALELPGEGASASQTSSSRQKTAIRAKASGSSKKKPQPKARKTQGSGREVVYRELSLLPSSSSRRKRIASRVGIETEGQLQVEVGAIDVMTASDVDIHPFLIVVKYSGSPKLGAGECVVKVFAERTMAVLGEDDVVSSDEWSLGLRTELHQALAVFAASSTSETLSVLYPCRLQPLQDEAAADRWWWGLEIRDCGLGSVTQRLVFDISSFYLEWPVMLLRSGSCAAEAKETVLLVDGEGRMANEGNEMGKKTAAALASRALGTLLINRANEVLPGKSTLRPTYEFIQ